MTCARNEFRIRPSLNVGSAGFVLQFDPMVWSLADPVHVTGRIAGAPPPGRSLMMHCSDPSAMVSERTPTTPRTSGLLGVMSVFRSDSVDVPPKNELSLP